MAAVQGELGLVDAPGAQVGGDEGDRLRPTGGEHQAVGRQVEAGGQGRLGGLDVGVAPEGAEVRCGQRGDVGGHGVEAGRQVEDLVGPQPEGGGHAGPVAAVVAGRGDGAALGRVHGGPPTGRPPARAVSNAVAPAPARRAARTHVTSRDRETAAAMS